MQDQPSEGPYTYLHKTAQHRTMRTSTIPCAELGPVVPVVKESKSYAPWIMRFVSAHSSVWDIISIFMSEVQLVQLWCARHNLIFMYYSQSVVWPRSLHCMIRFHAQKDLHCNSCYSQLILKLTVKFDKHFFLSHFLSYYNLLPSFPGFSFTVLVHPIVIPVLLPTYPSSI